MSLNTLKEMMMLKPCSSSSSSSSQITQPQTNPSSFTTENPNRKPPKSSLCQQMLRLSQDYDFTKQKQQQQQQPDVVVEECKEDDDQEEGFVEFSNVKNINIFKDDNDFGCGPYQPLILDHNVQVPASINCRLLEHQREGVKFLYNLYSKNLGGILGDDMGLGKTIQAIAFLSAIYGKDADATSPKENDGVDKGPTLIICPSSVIQNWEDEFSKWSTFSVAIYHGANRDTVFDKIGTHGTEILITSFDTYRINENIMSQMNWEIVIIDEAHRLKNEKSKLYEACLAIKTRKRYGLTGTVMQNKIMELFNLFDLVVPGGLGTREHFRDYYDEPLKHGQRSSAPERFVQVAAERKKHLVSVLHKFLLRRTKEETIGHLMMGKEDNVVFCAMSDVQKRVYKRMLQLPDVQCLINKELPCSCGSPLKQVECCNRTVPNGVIWPYLHKDNPDGCDSCPYCIVLPCLTKLQQISNHLELIKPNPRDDTDKQQKDKVFASAVFGTDIDLVGGYTQNESFMGLSDVQHCGKMRALENLMSSWILHGDKILLFSYSVRMLDILEKLLIRKGYSFSRLDGSTPTSLRQSYVDDFNTSPSKQVFLISTRAGGLGLNLVSANRVVIFDPNWNPSHDLQAQDRSFRFGQKRHVEVFRLLAAGSLEELVYSRQIYKQQLANIAVSGKLEKRYFEGVQDCKEFRGELFGISNLFRDLSDKLFTSEILHKEGTQHEHKSETQSLPNIGMCFLPSQARDSFSLESSDTEINKRSASVDEQLGIVYAHRNEDIISHERGCDVTHDVSTSTQIHSSLPDIPRKKPSTVGERGNNASLKAHKLKQYRYIARFMGMEVVEFSKWFLSASVAEREQVLRNYKRRKEKMPLHIVHEVKMALTGDVNTQSMTATSTAAQRSLAYFTELNPADNSKFIEARVYQKWTAMKVPTFIPTGFSCILIDKKGIAIQADSDLKEKERFEHDLQLNCVYRIQGFGFEKTDGWGKTLDNDMTLCFGKHTQVDLIQDDSYPYHYFNFAAYNELGTRLEKKNPILTDYIGYIHNVEKVKEFGGATGNKIKLRNIEIRNLNNNVVVFTLWNEKAKNFEEDEYMKMKKPVIIAVSSCYLKTYGGQIQLSATSATSYYFNPPVEETTALLTAYNESDTSTPQLEVQTERFTEWEQERTRNRVALGTLLQIDPNTQQRVLFTQEVMILRIDNTQDWYYQKCDECGGKLRHRFVHGQCHPYGTQPKPEKSYSFKLIMTDGTGNASMTCFSPHTDGLIKDINTLLEEVTNKDPGIIPPQISALENTRHVFQFRFAKPIGKGPPTFVLQKVMDHVPSILPAPAEGPSSPPSVSAASEVATQVSPPPATPPTTQETPVDTHPVTHIPSSSAFRKELFSSSSDQQTDQQLKKQKTE